MITTPTLPPHQFIHTGKLWSSGSLLQPLPATPASARNTISLETEFFILKSLGTWHVFSQSVERDTLND